MSIARFILGVLFVLFVLPRASAGNSLPAGAVARFGEPSDRDSGVSAVAYSPDGRLLASGESHAIRLWDVANGRELKRLEKPPYGAYSVAFSPDGHRLASGGFDGMVRLWDASTGKELYQMRGHPLSVEWVAFSPDGRQVVSAGKDQAIRLWDVTTGQVIRTLTGHASWVFCAVFTLDGKQLISGGRDTTIRIWDVASGNQTRQLGPSAPAARDISSHTDLCLVVLSPDGQNLLSAKNNQQLLIWNVKSGRIIRRLGDTALYEDEPIQQGNLQGFTYDKRIYSAGFSPDGRTVATAQNDDLVLWETASGKVRGRFHGHLGVVSSVAFAPDGKTIASGSRDGTVLIWDLLSPGKKAILAPDALWDRLADSDASRAYEAVCNLIAHPKEAVRFLNANLKPLVVDFQQIDRLIRDLDDDSFNVRNKATQELRKMEEAPEAKLRQVLAGKPSLEVRRRVGELLHKIAQNKTEPSPQQLQSLRAVEVLESIGTPEAKDILQRLAHGTPGLRLTEDAKASGERMNKKGIKASEGQ